MRRLINPLALALSGLLVLGICLGIAQNAPSANPPVGVAGAYLSSAVSCTDGQACWIQTDQSGYLRVTQGGSSNFTIATIPTADITGAASFQRVQSIAGTNSTSIKGSSGNIYSMRVCNASAVGLYLKIYDKATAPTVGTDTPKATMTLATGTCLPTMEGPIAFTLGIGIGLTSGVADSSTGGIGADNITGYIQYK